MSGLISDILRNAQSLNLHARTVETAGHNLANQNDPAYARQRTAPKEASTIYTTFGLQPGGVPSWGREHARSFILDKQVVRGQGEVAYAEAQRETRANLQIALGEEIDRKSSTASLDTIPDSDTVEGSLSKRLTNFSMHSKSCPQTWGFFCKGSSLPEIRDTHHSFQLVDKRVEEVRSNLQEKVADEIEKVEDLLDKISTLNERIYKLEFRKQGLAVDMRDERQKAIEELAGLVSVEMAPINDSVIGISAKTDDGQDVLLVGLDGRVGEIFDADGQLTFDPLRGSIAGIIDSEAAIDKLKNENLDLLAQQLVTSVNAAYNDGSADNFFDADSITAGGLKLDGSWTPEVFVLPLPHFQALMILRFLFQNLLTRNSHKTTMI